MPQTITSRYLTQLVNVVKEQHQTGLLRIEQIGRGSNELGEIYFENGRIFNARVGEERGISALKRISAWEHAIYTFQHIHRPPQVRISDEQGTSEHLVSALDLLLGAATPAQVPEARAIKMLQRRTSVVETPHPPFAQQSRQVMSSTRVKTILANAPAAQAFVLRGETLEEYTPASPPHMSPARQRWTTHRQDEPEHMAESEAAPAHSVLENGVLPGRQAIYKARVTITSTESMHNMGRRERLVFVLLDGRRTIQHISKLLHLAESEVGQVLLKLEKLGFVECTGG